MLNVHMEQRVNLKFIVKLYGNECLSRRQVFEWFKQFKEGRETTEDGPRPGRPTMSKTDNNIENIGLLDTVTLKGTIVEAVKAKVTEV
ncbi:hypothetical protein NQ318_017429 [Aromia moschata]|uniref:Mos1 transposase HTH domain-containing protein n=1 Tax=Aromia moschata TaxID=1265417 RepID=A0AAV8Z533_9CUCU|nr:hypothetical protein NQ318_017429 [Aromia moschata]